MKVESERDRHEFAAVPAELDHGAFEPGKGECQTEAFSVSRGVEYEIAVPGQLVVRQGKARAEGSGDGGTRRLAVDQGDGRARKPCREISDETADDAGANHGDPVAEPRRSIPAGVERRLH